MKNKNSMLQLLSGTLIILFALSACNEYNEPGIIYNSDVSAYTASPTITGISPADSMMAGIREVTITGQNFATDTSLMRVYFGSQKAIVKSATPTSLVVYRPQISGNLMVKVEIPTALGIPRVPYKVEAPVVRFGVFAILTRGFFVMEMDRNDYVWIGSSRTLYKVTPDGLYPSIFMGNTILKPPFAEPTDMRFGPGGLLYVAVKSSKIIYTINTTDSTQAPGTYVTFPNNVEKMDFDQNGNLFAGKANGLFRVDNATKAVTATGHYINNFSFVDIHIFNHYVYVASGTSISKTIINADGSLGSSDELVVDILNNPAVSQCTINSFSIAADGTIYLALKGHPDYSVFVLGSDGSVTPFYTDNILPKKVDQMFWGNGRYLFLFEGKGQTTDATRSVNKMGLDKNGAPYLGRTL
jgi:hypothetical protein